MNIVLIGYRCSGKTNSGKIVAEKMGRGFMDADSMIEERVGCTIEEIANMEGWERFRGLEKELIKELSRMDNLVIATGGGAVIDEENVINLKKNGFVVWLKAGIDIIKERMEKDELSGISRPSLMGEDPVEEIRKVLEIREPLYRKAMDFELDTSHLSILEAADLIMKKASMELAKR
jgi:shikimate kinase